MQKPASAADFGKIHQYFEMEHRSKPPGIASD
jgi:hypothetical protein